MGRVTGHLHLHVNLGKVPILGPLSSFWSRDESKFLYKFRHDRLANRV